MAQEWGLCDGEPVCPYLHGESRVFRMVDQNGQAQHHVSWTISNVEAFSSWQSDELRAVALKAGEYRLTARSDFAVAEGTITVVEGSELRPSTVRWSSGSAPGCRTTRIIPAVPTLNGPDIFEQSICEDGEYVAAYTAEGVQLWRRKTSNHGGNAAQVALDDVVAQQSQAQKRFADKPYANAFGTFQSNRMRSGFCSQWRAMYAQ